MFERQLGVLERNTGTVVGITQMQEFSGLLEFVSRFTENSFSTVSLAQVCLRAPLRKNRTLCPVSKEVVVEANIILAQLWSARGE